MKKTLQADNKSWDGLENMADMGEGDIYEDLDEPRPVSYSRNSKEVDSTNKRRSLTKSRSRSPSSSSSRVSRRHSGLRTEEGERHNYRKSRSRETVQSRNSNCERGREKVISTPTRPGSLHQEEERAPSTSYNPPPYYQPPPSAQGQYQGNYQWQYHHYQERYSLYDSRAEPSPSPSTYSQSLSLNLSQPPPSHEYVMSGRPLSRPPSNWEVRPGKTCSTSRQPSVMAVEEESLQQKRTLTKQREDYIKRKISLSRDLSRLAEHKKELLKGKSKDNERMLKQNAEMQDDVLQQLKSVENVIDILTNIIGDSANLPEIIRKEAKNMEEVSKKFKKKKRSSGEKRHERGSTEAGGKNHSRSPLAREEDCIYYDPGIHWCSDCNVFPKTVSDYFDHLHSQQHKQNTKLRFEDFPWHTGQNIREVSPQYSKEFPLKRVPIRAFLNACVSINKTFRVHRFLKVIPFLKQVGYFMLNQPINTSSAPFKCYIYINDMFKVFL